MPVVFINPSSHITIGRVIVVAKVTEATRIVVCYDDHSRDVSEGIEVCRQCPSFVGDSCTASPGDTCSWGMHVGYDALTEYQQEVARRSSYLKGILRLNDK